MPGKLAVDGWPRTRLLLILCISFLSGLLLAKWGISVSGNAVLLGVIVGFLALRNRRLAFLVLPVIVLIFGIWRGQLTLNSFAPIEARYGQTVSIDGVVANDTLIADNFQTEFFLTNLRISDGNNGIRAGGRLRVRGFPNNKLNRGDRVHVSGKLRPALGNYQGQISFAQIEILARKDTWLETIRRRFFAGVFSTMPEPAGSLGLGFLVGARALLPASLNEQLSITGLTHIVAVSGYNLTILVRFMRRLLVKFSKYLATAASLGLIGAFLAVTGSSPSIVRAAIVSTLALGAWYYGRPIKPSVLILLAASISSAINPTYFWFDIGWYLSFLAFFGVLVIAPALTKKIFSSKKPRILAQVLMETLSAQLMTLPLIMFIFGKASLIAIPANLLILPLIPFAMFLTFIAGIGGMVVNSAAGWLAWPANQLMHLIIVVIERLASIPGALKSANLTAGSMIVIYASLLLGTIALRRKLRKPLAKYSVIE